MASLIERVGSLAGEILAVTGGVTRQLLIWTIRDAGSLLPL